MIESLQTLFSSGKAELSDILGQDGVKIALKSALITGRNVIIVGPPGVGKTTLAKNVAKLLPKGRKTAKVADYLKDKLGNEDNFVRVQGSPDLTAEDLIGDIDPLKALKFGPLSIEAFTPGKIFKAHGGILFFDEINRCPQKLQNALLQVLEEKKVTIGSYDVDVPSDFVLIATMNPADSSTEPLSQVFLDRFDIISMTYPETSALEEQIVRTYGKKILEFGDGLFKATIGFVRRLRENKDLEQVPGVRASIGLYERAQSNAFLNKRKRVTRQDIEDVVVSVLSHRIQMKPSVKYLKKPEDFVMEEFLHYSQSSEELKDEGEAP